MKEIFEQIFESSPVAMLLVDSDSKICLLNKHAESLFLYKRDELLGQNLDVLLPESVKNKHPDLVQRYFDAPLARRMGIGRQLHGVKKDKTTFPIEVGLNPILSEEKTYVMSSIIDVTERNRAEERFRAAVDAAPNGMLMIDENGDIVLLNQQIEAMFGYSKQELIGSPIETLVPEEVRQVHPAFVRSFIGNPEARAMGMGRELFGQHKSGELFPVEIGLKPITSDDGIFVISSIVDISQRKRAEEKIHEQTAELEQFAYRTSHDLRSPLLSIQGLIDILILDAEEGQLGEVIENAKRINGLASRLRHLVEDILLLTRTDMESEEPEAFDFEDYIAGAKEKFSHLLHEQGVSITFISSVRRSLWTQRTRLIQVLDNLISNAIKYCDPEKENRYVKLAAFHDTDYFHIQVEDNGLGVPSDKHAEMFQMFKRFHGNRADGSGLGLYIIKKHLAKLNAKVEFESSPKGTSFYLSFPLIPGTCPIKHQS